MSKLASESQPASIVNPEWYLATYPDVAASGMDPQDHYSKYGLAEGRIPRQLKSHVLETATWGGFSKLAIHDLIKWHKSSNDDHEKSYACWALARWYASGLDWASALNHLQMITLPLTPLINRTAFTLLRSEILVQCGLQVPAQECVQLEIDARGPLSDLCLSAANVYLPTGADGYSREAIKLHWINQIFESEKLYPLVKAERIAELTIDNVKCAERSDPIWEEHAKISVIMPAYNSEDYIQTAIRGLFAQTWQNIEILIVDDGSTDNTVRKILDLAKLDTRIKLLRQPTNKGSYAARNLALQHATGIFIVNHDSDDWSHSQRLELMIRPLQADTSIVATIANWVRCEPNLHFKTWRIENHLIEPSVSTMMFRTDAIRRLGGWDEVRVAADYELSRRLLHYYGAEAVVDVLPGIPLVFARQLPNSLTMATGTHVRTSLFGLRKLYTSLAESWRSTLEHPSSLKLKPGEDSRPFPVPLSMLNKYISDIPNFDWLLIGNFSQDSTHSDTQEVLLSELISSGARVALFHWPDYSDPRDISRTILSLAVNKKITIVLAEQTIHAPHAAIIDSKLLEHPLDNLPVIKGYKGCHIINSQEQLKSLIDNLTAKSVTPLLIKQPLQGTGYLPPEPSNSRAEKFKASTNDSAELHANVDESFFDAEWYLERYPDVLKAGIDPREHYINNGYKEGREPGPDFNTPWYQQQCPAALSSGISPLVHYEKIGRSSGYNPRHPTLKGSQTLREGSPTILLCAHAADTELFGAERSLLDILDACIELKLNIIVSVPSLINKKYVEDLRSRAVAVTCIFTQPWNCSIPPCKIAIERFRDIIQNYDVDLVQVNTVMLREPLMAAKQAGVPSIVHAHESPLHDAALCAAIGLSAEKIKAHILEASDYLIANSEFTATHLNKPDATYVVGGMIDAKAFNVPNVVNKERITAALISSNSPKKGLQDFLQLALELAPDTTNIQLMLIGPHTPAVAALKKLEDRGQLPTNISLIPYTSTALDAISKANIVLNLSHCQETFGRTLLEGMAAGRPVLAYRWGALPELVDDGVQGHVVEYGDIKAIADRIRQMCRNPKKIRTLGTAGRKHAKRYNLRRVCKQLEAAYAVVLGSIEPNPTQILPQADNSV
ncbi:glycosyltransferase [Pseudomonas promysalinigenes]|uniref:glycosyltransferase n=1 Tax=Pseudomonas promysalinigenes TaxID=485898 RepID=UPI003F9EE61D